MRSAFGRSLNPVPWRSGRASDPDGGLDRVDRGYGRGSVLRDVRIQAGEGTEAPPAPGAKDGVPQSPAAMLTVTVDRHGFSKVSLMSRYRQSGCHQQGFAGRPVEGVIEKRKGICLLFRCQAV
jgi:hypothetical protein